MQPTKEAIEQKRLSGLTNTQIAIDFNITVPTLRYYLKKFNLPTIGNIVAHNREHLVDQEFGLLTVKSRSHTGKSNRQAYWNCECKCGGKKIASTTMLKKGIVKSCGCLNHKSGEANERYKGYKDISGGYIYQIKSSAKNRDLEFTVSLEYLWLLYENQNRKCAISGEPLVFTKNYRFYKDYQNASLDRIDSSKGYIEGNVQWVHKKVNLMKNSMTDKELIEWCMKIVSNAYLEKN